MSRLDEIVQHKRREIAESKRRNSLEQLIQQAAQKPPAKDFLGALVQTSKQRGWPALIAEIKRASPSRGQLAPIIDVVALAQIYQENGASAISVLTDQRFFNGSLEDLRQVASLPGAAPVLRKDFILDAYQVYEARAAGADAYLLIAACLDQKLLKELYMLGIGLGMTPLVEVHNEHELEIALSCEPVLVGINNRNLSTFEVNLETTLKLKTLMPQKVCLVAESGIHSRQDVACLAEAGVQAILVGEALVTAQDIPEKVRSLAWSK